MSSNVNPFEVKFFRACDTLNDVPGMVTFKPFDTNPSLLPVKTWYLGPFANAIASLVAIVMISAHETVSGHSCSKVLLMSSIRSNPRSVWFGLASFSDFLFSVESISIEASQP
ncbi:Peroxidase superfamily protein [Trifolium repens]|nr:Peroxidase superfamily protein [Trifolium repens]